MRRALSRILKVAHQYKCYVAVGWTMAEGTNEFLREIDELLGDEVEEVGVKDESVTDTAKEP